MSNVIQNVVSQWLLYIVKQVVLVKQWSETILIGSDFKYAFLQQSLTFFYYLWYIFNVDQSTSSTA